MHKFFRIIILYIALASPAILWAQESFTNRYNTIYITMNEGLPNNFVDDIYKDRQGFLWISMSGGGLARYDGYEFVNFTPATPHCRLKSNFIRKVYEDNFQRLWVVSEGGTDIIDLTTMQSVLPHDPRKKLETLIKQPAFMVTQDANGCIWLYCSNSLHRIAFRTNGDIESIHSLEIPNPYRYDIIFKDVENEGKVWIGINGALYKIGITAQSKLEATLIDDCLSFAPDLYFTDFIAKENEVWIATDKGLYRYNKNEGIVKQYMHTPDNPHSLSQNFLTCLAITNDKQLLVASLKGINIYNPIKDNFERISDQASNTGSKLLNSNFINCIIVEGQHIWVGTESGGINKMTAKRLSIQNYQHDNKNLQTISHNPVNAVYEDNSGNLWVGTVEGGLNKKAVGSDSFIHYTYESGTLTHNSVSAITADGQGRLWIGTWGGGINLINPQNPQHRIEAITARNKDNYPIDFIGALAYDSINNGMWIGANQGLFFYDLAHKQLCSPFAKRAAEDIRGCIGSIIDKDGQLWMGCLDGVYIIDLHSPASVSLPEGTFRYRHLKYKLDDPSSGLIEKICCFYETQDGTLWLGSNGYGIYKRMQNEDGKEQFVCYNSLHGLPDNSIRSILEDDKGCIWIATNNGLSRFQPTENHFINYNRQDGLADTQFYWNAAHRSQYSKLYLGTVSGLVAIDCNLPALTTQSSKVRFTHLKVGNEEIFPGNEYLPLDIAVSKAIRIHEREKSFSLEFTALNYESDNTATYSYRLLGFDNRWIHVPASRRFATYTNLSPGNYTLQVKYTPYTPTEEDNITELQITIQPYFYKTTWFILLVIILATFATWQFYQWRIRSLKEQKARLHQKVEQRTHELKKQKQLLEEQTEELSRQNRMLKQQNEKITRQKAQLTKMTRKIQELTLDKIAFFTNITHEFRTPITLIIGPIERALKLSYNPQVIEQLHFVERNSKYLLSLVNQLMDFRKVESGKLEIVKSRNNFLKFANELIIPFEVFAKERDITVKRYFRMPSPEISYDEEAMHKVLTNLLSNAIKFTPNGGSVSLFIALLPPADNRKSMLYICVSDTGSGIPDDDTIKIFNRFYQSQGQTKYPMYGQAGSGIGLYLCKRIVQMHGGEIHAQNNHTIGCSLRILLPTTPESNTVETLVESAPQLMTSDALPPSNTFGKGLSILVVEDNADMRGYIRSILRDKYNVFEAAHGAEALNILNSHSVDFIISDLMMPVMDGIELSRRVKENFAISHIPFLMLTAKTSQESRLESYRIGVDEYLLKPFDETLLLTRIENILENRKRYQKKFAIAMDVDALNMEEESGDKKFLNRIMNVIKENYKNSYFEVSDFCETAGVSKSLLNKKLQSLVGQSAGQFIRNYRLNIARELVLKNRENKSMSIAEIAYEVGFNDPKYFTRCFTKYFNTTPSSLLNEREEPYLQQ